MAKINLNPSKLTTADSKFNQRREDKVAKIKDAGDLVLQAGYPHDFGEPYGVQHLQLRNNEDKINWQTVMAAATVAAMQGAGDMPGPNIRTAENNTIQITFNEALMILSTLIGWAESKFMISWAKTDATRACTSDAELDLIDPNSGWE